ncbi:FTR1 family iron permease [Candidatus Nitrosotenuis cloacae]|uniref:FTR1 family iron permease n=1 Tax=Candidatus Nitrosotenuis cloacae TaxID=1603555 RepID=UPI00227E7843|nr:FTR1 family protein [Candidatus Nitrosotenuis cloacae]
MLVLKYGLLSVILLTMLVCGNAYAQDATQIATVGKVVQVGLDATKSDIMQGDFDGAEKYSRFTAEYFARNLGLIRQANAESADNIHLLLLDIHSKIENNSPPSDILSDIQIVETHLDKFPSSDKTPQVIAGVLSVADERYQVAISENDLEMHMLAASLVDEGITMFNVGTFFDERQTAELNSFFNDLKSQISEKRGFVQVGKMITTIQRDLTGTHESASNSNEFFDTIRHLYDQALLEIENGNYDKAEEHVIAAYLDNFEYLEAPIEAVDSDLMHRLEINMREEVRDMIQNKKSRDEIQSFINDSILSDLRTAEDLIAESLPVQTSGALSSPERELKEMGSATREQKSGVMSEIDFIRSTLETMLEQYKQEDYQAAFTSARTAYLDSYEHVEIPLRTIDPDFTLEVELQFAELRNLISQKADYKQVQEATIVVRRSLDESERMVTGTGQLAPTIAFTSSFAVIFREGLESVLVLGAILTYLEASRNTHFKKYVYYGIVIAVGATAVTWMVASYLITISGANRELIEAVAALSATAVLFYVSFWILNKIEHKKWMEFVKAKVWQASTTGGTAVFVMLSFFTVYREGFETVLFYEAMFGFAKYMEMYVGLGFIAGIGTLLAVYFVTRKIGKRLPLKMLFGLTMGVGAYLSIAFLGNAIRELQTLDIVPFTSLLGIMPRLDINLAKMTGIYPTLETLVAQVILLAVYLVAASYVLILRPRKEEKIAAMRKSRKEVDEFETH